MAGWIEPKPARRENLANVMVVVKRQPNLPEIVLARRSAGRFACRLHCRNEDSDENADDGDHDQQLDDCESSAVSSEHVLLLNKGK
jgi:hypothetical protein